MSEPVNQTTALRRELARWAAMSPKAIAEGSPAQFMYAMADAQHDIATLADEIDRLRAALREVRSKSGDQWSIDTADRALGEEAGRQS